MVLQFHDHIPSTFRSNTQPLLDCDGHAATPDQFEQIKSEEERLVYQS